MSIWSHARAGSPRTQKHYTLRWCNRVIVVWTRPKRVRCLTIRTFRRRSLQNTLAHNGHSSIHWALQTWCVHPCLAQLSATLPNLVRKRRVASSSAHVQSFLSFFQNATKYNLVQQIMPEGIANTTTRKSTDKNTSMQSVTTEEERE